MSEQTQENKYAVLLEHNDEECEAWYYFIKYRGNEDALKHLQRQLEKVEFELMENSATFDLDLEHLVSETTAKEMTKIEVNHYSFHRKFDGKLQMIDFEFRKRDSNDTRMCKVYDLLGCGGIDEFIDCEDVDPEDLVDGVSTDDESFSDDSEDEPVKQTRLPPAIKQEIPRYAKIKQRHHKKK